MSGAISESVLLTKNVLSLTTKNSNQILFECGRAAYTTARSVMQTKVFQMTNHVNRLYMAIAGLFPEEQKSLNITKEEIRNTMISNVRKARDFLCEKNPAIAADKLNVKFSVIIEKPSKEDRLPMTILIAPVSKPHNPPIVCDVYHVIRQNAMVKDSKWVIERDQYYKKSGKGVEDILLCENDCMYEGGQSNFFAVKNGTVYTRGDGVLQGTMRSMVLTLCEKLNIPVCLESPRLSEISQWDACFITSTSRSVMNINTEDGKILKEFVGENKVVKEIVAAVENELILQSEPVF